MIEPGTRVRYTGSWYPGLTGKEASVQFESDGFLFVSFHYKPHLGNLPCEENELEVL
jgi:hypothetical protein